jgi:predicted RNA binding protein YcfA (HicA-like mRNA interferase family)
VLGQQAQSALTWLCSTVLHMTKAARVLAALKRDGWIESRRPGSHRVLAEGDQQRTWAYHDGGPMMARIAATTATPLLNCGSYRTIW